MADTATPIFNGADNPQYLRDLQNMVALMRMAFAPVLNDNIDCIEEVQSKLISASALFSGTTVGHMLAVGALDAQAGDREQAKLVAMQCFDQGVELGIAEALKVMAQQRPRRTT